jgi:hypothetical protein
VRGQAPHYLGNTTNPAVRRALLTTVAHLLDLELDVTPFEATVRAFRTQCDQAVAKDAAVQAYVRQLEQDYDAPGDEAARPRRDEDFRRFLKKNFLIQEAGAGLIKMSYLGNSGWRSRRFSTARIARLLSVTPFW